MTLRRSFWYAVENLHHGVYFSPDAKDRFAAVGLKGYWMGYMASRSAALGTPPPEVVIATFYGFAPAVVRRALPDAWERASRDDILAARYDVARATIGPALADTDLAAMATALQSALPLLDYSGRALAAAHASLPAPDDDLATLWHGATVLREFRGDSHNAVLATNAVDGVESNVLAVATGVAIPGQRDLRGWSEEEWAAGTKRLADRGWVEADGSVTEAGIAARTAIEEQTDAAVAKGVSAEAEAVLGPVADALVAASKAVVAGAPGPH